MKRIAIVGFDHLHALAYLDVFMAHPQVDLVGICDGGMNRDLAGGRAADAGVAYADDLDAYLDWDVDGIYVGTTPNRHLSVVAAAAGGGVHVMCDKPIATNVADADAILDAVGRAGVGLTVPFRPLFQEPVRLALSRLRSGTVGEVQAVYAVKYGRPPSEAPGGMSTDWFHDPAQAGFGGFGDIGSHALDAMCRIVDSVPERVYARIGDSGSGTIDDLGVAHLEFPGGVHGVLAAGWVNPAASARWLEVRFEILTTTHAFVVSAPYREIELVTNQERRLVPWERDDLNRHVDDFVAAMSGRAPEVGGVDARNNLVVLLAAYRSAADGQPVALPA